MRSRKMNSAKLRLGLPLPRVCGTRWHNVSTILARYSRSGFSSMLRLTI